MSRFACFMYSTGKVISYSVRTIAALHILSMNYFELSETSGESMLPTLAVMHDSAVVDKRFKFGRNIGMGDLIVARKPTEPSSLVTKRVTGMPGDIILIDPSKNTLSNLRLVEGTTEIQEIKTTEDATRHSANYDNYVVVPEGHCWVTGDNLSASLDSRTYSVVPMAMIEGKLKYAWYHPNLSKILSNYPRELENTFVQEL